MNDKYELIAEDFVEVLGRRLFRIRSKKTFSRVAIGDKGGFVESERNLSPYGNAWVSEDAWVSGDASVSKPTDILVIGPVGSRSAYFSVIVPSGKVKVGCFEGSLDDLEKAAKERDRQDYLDLLPGIRAIVSRRQVAKE